MKLSDFDYTLPEELIAQYPAEPRDAARLLVVDRASGTIRHDIFRNIHAYLPSRSLLVVNNSKVIPARLLGQRSLTGGQVEVFLLKQVDAYHFEAMLRPLKKIKDGETLVFPGDIRCQLVDRDKRTVRFEEQNVLKKLEAFGHIPLPPYIKRPDEALDREYYQTVYAKSDGSVASPTAGLHFTKPLMASLEQQGHEFSEVTLHVNYGTFKPVETENILQHPMHVEEYSMGEDVSRKVAGAKEQGRKVIAVGTTSCRTLESFARTGDLSGSTDLFLYPGCDFKLVEGMITNFHLPRTTLLMLVSALAGRDLILRAYEEAVRERYRFYSYGDAMIIV